jgi:hypothetical protein
MLVNENQNPVTPGQPRVADSSFIQDNFRGPNDDELTC